MLRVLSPSPNTTLKIPPQIASLTMMAPQKASSQTAATFVASKGKKIVYGGTSSVDHHPQNSNIVLQSVEKRTFVPKDHTRRGSQ